MNKVAKAGGCGCLMLFAGVAVLLVVAVQNAPRESGIASTQTPITSPYPFIRAATDADGSVMEFYHATTSPSVAEATAFFSDLKSTKRLPRLYVAVLVDDPKWARAPNNPFTALFGIDEATMRHVNAVFELDARNGFSEAQVFAANMAESRATRVKIP